VITHSFRLFSACLITLATLLLVTGCGDTKTVTVVQQPSVVVKWNEAMLAAIRNSGPRPTVVARSLYMVHAAMYDAWSMYDSIAIPTVLDPTLRRPASEHNDDNKAAAVSQAAYHMLIMLFPNYETQSGAFKNLLMQFGYQVISANETVTPAGVGRAAAFAQWAARENDGSNATNNFADTTSSTYPALYVAANSANPSAPNYPGKPGFDTNRWQPLRVPNGSVIDAGGLPVADDANPKSFSDQVFLTPHWGAVKPFALASGNQFRPPAPPQAGSSAPYTDGRGVTLTNDEAYHAQLEEVLAISAGLTDKQKVIAELWADGPRSETPPGHWNAISHGISQRDRHGIDNDVKMYFSLNGAVFDASIAAWEAKRHYDFIRPTSAIRHKYTGKVINAWGGPNKGTISIPGEAWRPYQSLTFVTPPFSEFVSGHSTFSAAVAEVISRFTGTNRLYDGVTVLDGDFNRDGIPDMLGEYIARIGSNSFESTPTSVITLRWNTLQEAADEAGVSRLYGGIHIQDGDLRGRTLGKNLGAQAFARAQSYWSGTFK